MVKKGGIWVHHGTPDEELDPAKAVIDGREERLNQLSATIE
jgi:hypothetical protein